MKHEPRPEFIQRLEERVSAEARRRSHAPVTRPRWMPGSPMAAAIALAAIIVVSMGLGGAAVAARYQAQDNREREQLALVVARQLELAKAKLDAAIAQMKLTQQRVATGIESEAALKESRVAAVQAEVQVRVFESQFAEIRSSGREPRDTISAPIVNGQDFVLARMRLQLEAPRAALDMEQTNLQRDQQRFNVGMATNLDLATTRNRILELEAALRLIEQKINVRRQFVAGQLDEPMAELRVMEAEAEQRRSVLMPRLDLAQKVFQDFKAKVSLGAVSSLELKQAELKLYELEVEIKKVELDLSVVKRQIEQRRGK